jgi:hypothetical protein
MPSCSPRRSPEAVRRGTADSARYQGERKDFEQTLLSISRKWIGLGEFMKAAVIEAVSP